MAAHAANCPAWFVTARTVRRHGHIQCGRMISRPLKHVARRSGRGTPPKAVSALSLAGRRPTSRGDYVSKVAPPLPSLSFHQRGLASGPKPRNRAYLTLAHRQVIATCLPCVNCPPGRGPHARSHPPLVIPTDEVLVPGAKCNMLDTFPEQEVATHQQTEASASRRHLQRACSTNAFDPNVCADDGGTSSEPRVLRVLLKGVRVCPS